MLETQLLTKSQGVELKEHMKMWEELIRLRTEKTMWQETQDKIKTIEQNGVDSMKASYEREIAMYQDQVTKLELEKKELKV